MHPLKKLTTNPQNFSLRKTLFSDHKGSAATNGVNKWPFQWNLTVWGFSLESLGSLNSVESLENGLF